MCVHCLFNRKRGKLVFLQTTGTTLVLYCSMVDLEKRLGTEVPVFYFIPARGIVKSYLHYFIKVPSTRPTLVLSNLFHNSHNLAHKTKCPKII